MLSADNTAMPEAKIHREITARALTAAAKANAPLQQALAMAK